MIKTLKKKNYSILSLSLLILGIIFVLIIVYGTLYLRLSGDDYQLTRLAREGFFEYQKLFLTKLNGRFTYSFATFLLYQFPRFAIALTPLLFLGIFISGALLWLRKVLRDDWISPIAGAVFLSIALVMMPENTYQSVYWLPAYVAYALPLGLLVFYFLYLKKLLDRGFKKNQLFIALLFALIIGGLHELVAAFACITIFSIYILSVLNLFIKKKINLILVRKWSTIALASIAGFTLAVIVNYSLPATAFRKNVSQVPVTSKRLAVKSSWNYTTKTYVNNVAKPILLTSTLLLTILMLVVLKNNTKSRDLLTRKLHPGTIYFGIALLALIPFTTLLLTALLMYFGQGLVPPDRTLFVFYFSLIMCSALFSVLLSQLVLGLSKSAINSTVTTLIILTLPIAAATLYSSFNKQIKLDSDLRVQSKSDDAREYDISRQIMRGSKNIIVPFHMTVGDTPYPKDNKDYWFNYELAKYYRVDSYRAL